MPTNGASAADAEPSGPKTKVDVDTKNLKLNLQTEGKAVRFDGKLKHVQKDLDILVELKARTGKFADESSEAIALQGKIDATFGKVKTQAEASLKQFETKLQYVSKDPGLKKVSGKLATDYRRVKAAFELFFQKKDTEVMVKALAAADKLEVELNAKTLTAGGTNVNAEVKATLDRVEAAFEVFKKNKETDAKFKLALESDYKDLKAAAEAVYTKTGEEQVQFVGKFEATLDRVRASVEAAIKTDSWRIGVGAGIDSKGTPSGKIEALVEAR